MGFPRDRQQMQHRVGRSARRRHRRNGILERRARENVARPHAAAHEIDDALAGGAGDVRLGRIRRRHAAAAERRDAEKLAGDRHRVRGELAAARARAGTRRGFEPAQIAVAHAAGGVRADGLEHVLNRDVLAVELPRRNRSAVEHQPRHVQARERHHGGGNRLVAADEDHQAVEAVAARDELDRVGDHLAADERGAHPLGAHRDAIGDRHGVELHRRAAGGADPLLERDRQLAQVPVARPDFDPGVGDADERLGEVRVGKAGAFEHRARGRAVRAGRQRIRSECDHDATSLRVAFWRLFQLW